MSEAKTTNKKVLTLNDIRGVDLSSAPLRVKSTHASYMKNMICKDGVNHKRNGFEEVSVFYDENGEPMRVNGMLSLSKENSDTLFVHAGETWYLTDSAFGNLYNCGEIGFDGKGQYFHNKEKTIIYANNHLFAYNGKLAKESEETTIYPLFDSNDAYVPTTSIGITDEKHGSLLEPYEGVNLFNTKRINKLVGSKNGTNETVDEHQITTLEKSEGVFFLDGEIDFTKGLIISADIYIEGAYFDPKENSWQLRAYYDKTLYEDRCVVKTTFDVSEEGVLTDGVSKLSIDGEQKEVLQFEEVVLSSTEYRTIDKFKVKAENENGRGKLTFIPALPSPVLGEDNITVTYHAAKKEPKIKAISECSVGTYNKMLAIATEDDTVYFSSPTVGYTYFPDNNYLKVIDNVSALFSGEDFLAVASENETAIITFSINSEGEKIECVPKLFKKHTDVGCIGAFSPACVEGDTLFLSNKGVYGVSTGGMHLRSSNINKELLSLSKEQLRNATGLEHEGRYYLFVDSNVYIADARYKTYESNRLDVSYEYEWWRWEDVPCRVAVVHQGQMLLGRTDGRVMKLGNGYKDKLHCELESGDMTNIDGKSFIFNETLGIKATDKIKLSGGLRFIAEGIFETHLDEKIAYIEFEYSVFFDLLLKNKLAKGKTLMVDIPWKGSGEKIDLTEWEQDNINQRIKFNYSSEIDTNVKDAVRLYEYISNECFDLEPSKNENYNLIDDFGEVVELLNVGSLTGILLSETPVECELHTAVLNFGTDVSKKTLHKMVLVPSADTVGEVSVGFETDKSEREKHQMVSRALSFDNLDFNSFSFDTAFYKTFEKRMHERNVSFVKFKFKSSGEGDFAIENFSCIYSLNSR